MSNTSGEKSVEERLAALEKAVGELQQMTQTLLERYARAEEPGQPATPSVPPASAETSHSATAKPAGTKAVFPLLFPRRDTAAIPPEASPPHFVRHVRARVQEALRNMGEETVETRIGTVWLSRLGAVVLLTAFVLVGQATFYSGAVDPSMKVLVGLAVGGILALLGGRPRAQRNLFYEVILGCGLATLYFTIYGAFFLEQMALVHHPLLGSVLTGLCLLGVAAIVHVRASQTAAGIALFLAFYTVALSTFEAVEVERYLYALSTCTLVAAVALVLHATHRWLFFTWSAMLGTYALYFILFRSTPDPTALPPQQYFWLTHSFLTVGYILFSLAFILNARKTGEYRRGVAPMSGINSALYFLFTYNPIETFFPEKVWVFRLGFAGLLIVFALFAETVGAHRNYLFQVFIAKAVIMVTLAMQAYLATETFLVALAIEGLGLAASYRRSGIVAFKIMGVVLLGVTFVRGLLLMNYREDVTIAFYHIPANWFSICGAAFFFCITAWFYEKFTRQLAPQERTVSGQWFLADTFLDWRSATLAMSYAVSAAFLVLLLTLSDLQNNVRLPFALTAEAFLFALLGMGLMTPQIEVAAVLLLAAAHACFHFFYWLPQPGFQTQTYFVPFTIGLAVLTFIAAHAWERYLRRYHPEAEDLEHHVIAALPYLLSSGLGAVLIAGQLHPLYSPSAMGALGLAFLLWSLLTRYSGAMSSAWMVFALSVVCHIYALRNHPSPTQESGYLIYLTAYTLTLCLAERSLTLFRTRIPTPFLGAAVVGHILVAAAGFVVTTGLYAWSPEHLLILTLLIPALIFVIVGAWLRESRYRWTALALFGLLTVQVFAFVYSLHSPYRELSFAAAGLVLLAVSYAYSQSRSKRDASNSSSSTVPPHGSA